MRNICVFVGSRANYSSIKTTMKAIKEHPLLDLQVVTGASALLPRFGKVEDLVVKDGFEINERFYMIIEGETPTTMAKSAGLGMMEFATILDNLEPDVLVVIGDRFEILPIAAAASYMNICIAHTMGGEVTGTIDESIRHAVTKLAHIHFPSNQESAERIIKLGEPADHVFNVGCPRMDIVAQVLQNGDLDEDLFKRFKGVGPELDLSDDFLLTLQHPVTTEFGDNRRQIEETLHALNKIKMPTIMIWPNVDAGSDDVSKGIRSFREKYKPDWLHLFVNLPTEIYIKLMDKTKCIVGNSSSAIREGAFIGVPAVNIGTRQDCRQRGVNVIDVDYNRDQIENAVRKQILNGPYQKEMIYGDGTAGKKIAEILVDVELRIQKKIGY